MYPFICQLLPRNSLAPSPGAQEQAPCPCHTVYHWSPSAVGLLWQHCHTLFFQKAFLANAKGHSLSLCHVLTDTLHPRECLTLPACARALFAFVADASELGGPAHPSQFHSPLASAACLGLGPRTPASPRAGRKEEVRMRCELQPDLGVTLASGVKRQKEGAGKEKHHSSLMETAPELHWCLRSTAGCATESVLLSPPKMEGLVLCSWVYR